MESRSSSESSPDGGAGPPLDTPPRFTQEDLVQIEYEWIRRQLDELDARHNAKFESAREKHLGVPPSETVLFGDFLPQNEPMRSRLALRRLALDAARYKDKVLVRGANNDSSPEWTPLRIGDTVIEVPKFASYFFDPGTIAEVPLVVRVFPQHATYLDVHCAATHAELGKAYREQLVDRAYDIDNPFRGRTLVATLTTGLDFDVVDNFHGVRQDVILPEGIWRELDENIRGLFDRIAVLRRADLGTNRGILLVGPPGTGKTAACRVIASELVGPITVVLCSAGVAQHFLRPLYNEVAHLSPALVLLEDLDLIVGDRDSGYTNKAALAEFLNVLDGLMTAHQGVATIATTNDPRTIDAAAKRSARFDRVVHLPLPDASARTKILSVYLRPLNVKGSLTPVAQATKGANGADLRELVRRGVLRHGERPTVQQLVALAEQLPRSTRVPAGFRLKTA